LFKAFWLSILCVAFTHTAQASLVTYSVSGFTYEAINHVRGREIGITGSVVFESESWSTGIDPYTGYTHGRGWDIVSGTLTSTDFHLHDISGHIWFYSGSMGSLFDLMWRINGEGSDLHLGNMYGGIRFYDGDGNLLSAGSGAIDGGYSQLAPTIRFEGENMGWLGNSFSNQIYSGGQLTLTQVPTPPAVYLFGSALGVMGWMRRKVSN
jgi:hypothetical protein